MRTPERPRVPLLALLIAACSPSATREDTSAPLTNALTPLPSAWPTFQGDNAHTGRRAVEPILRPRIAWRAQIGIQGWLNSPLLVADMVISPSSGAEWNAPDNMDGVVALDATTGKRRWFAPAKADVNSISYGMGIVVATGDEGAAWALDAATGKLLWHTPSRQHAKLYAPPIIHQGVAIVADARGDLRALDLRTGQQRWLLSLGEEIRAGLASDGELIYVATTYGNIYAMDTRGQLRWRLNAQGWETTHELPSSPKKPDTPSTPAFWAPPTISGELLIASYVRDTSYDDAALVAVNTRSGQVAWHLDATGLQAQWGNVRSSPVVSQEALFWGEPYSSDMASAQLRDGRLRFRSNLGACTFPHWASPVASSELVYLPRMDGTLWATSHGYGLVEWALYLGDAARAGEPYPLKALAKSQQCDWDIDDTHGLYASPALALDGSIFQGSGDGFLYKIVDATP